MQLIIYALTPSPLPHSLGVASTTFWRNHSTVTTADNDVANMLLKLLHDIRGRKNGYEIVSYSLNIIKLIQRKYPEIGIIEGGACLLTHSLTHLPTHSLRWWKYIFTE